MPAASTELDQLLSRLAALVAAAQTPPASPDAIDAVLASPPRVTAVRPLHDDPVIQAFRDELVDGLIRADTARQLLALLSGFLEKLPVR